MDIPFEAADQRLQDYCTQRSISLGKQLGHGIDGSVWESSSQSALQACYRKDAYERERDCYRRLLENDVSLLAGFQVPALLDYENQLQIIEMTIVFPPLHPRFRQGVRRFATGLFAGSAGRGGGGRARAVRRGTVEAGPPGTGGPQALWHPLFRRPSKQHHVPAASMS
jgi:hypothetical protein